MKNRTGKGFTKRVSNEKFSAMAKQAIEEIVRPQVEHHERMQKASGKIVLNASQKAHLVCQSPI